MTDSEYLQSIGSLTEHLLIQEISNEDMIGIIMDFKVACEYSIEAGAFNKEYVSCMLSEILSDDKNMLIVAPWIDQIFCPYREIVFN